MHFKKLASVTALLLVSACASGPTYRDVGSPPAGRAIAVVYREPAMASAAWPTSFWIDGKQFAELRAQGYSFVTIKPGEHTLHVNNKQILPINSLKFEAKAGQRLYFKHSVRTGAITPTGPGFLATNLSSLQLISVDSPPPELGEYKLTVADVQSLD